LALRRSTPPLVCTGREEYPPRAVTLGKLVVVSVVAVVTVGLAAGCTGDGGGGLDDGSVMRTTLSGDGCRYQGSTTQPPGSFALEVRNDTNEEAYFVLMMLPKDATLKDVESWFDQALRRWLRTGKYVLRPPIAWVTSKRIAPHAAGELPFNMFRRARLAVLCTRGSGRRYEVIAVAALDITP